MSVAGGGVPDEPLTQGHLGDLVADLVEGRLDNADPALVLQHLQRCPGCRDELADAVVAAAALRDVTGPLTEARPDLPAPAVHDRQPRPPDLRVRGRSRVLQAVAGVAVLAALAGGLLGGVALGRRTGPDSPARPPAAVAAPVTALFRAAGRTRGAAVVTGSGDTRRMTIDAEPGTPPAGTVVVVWLLAAGEPTQRVGALDAAGRGSFLMSADTAARYSRVVLSDQPAASSSLDAATVVATADLT